MQDGCLALAADAPEPRYTVIETARRLAAEEHRAVTVDDLRHATHLVACDRDIGHMKMSNRELNRWKWLARLLADPDDLEAMVHWQNPGMDERAGMEARVASVPGAMVAAICRNAFGTGEWRGLSDQDLKALVVILSNRAGKALARKEDVCA
jgi:hypothetical protein